MNTESIKVTDYVIRTPMDDVFDMIKKFSNGIKMSRLSRITGYSTKQLEPMLNMLERAGVVELNYHILGDITAKLVVVE